MGKFYDDLKKSFEDILDYRKGKITLRSEIIDKNIKRKNRLNQVQ